MGISSGSEELYLVISSKPPIQPPVCCDWLKMSIYNFNWFLQRCHLEKISLRLLSCRCITYINFKKIETVKPCCSRMQPGSKKRRGLSLVLPKKEGEGGGNIDCRDQKSVEWPTIDGTIHRRRLNVYEIARCINLFPDWLEHPNTAPIWSLARAS